VRQRDKSAKSLPDAGCRKTKAFSRVLTVEKSKAPVPGADIVNLRNLSRRYVGYRCDTRKNLLRGAAVVRFQYVDVRFHNETPANDFCNVEMRLKNRGSLC
jgi:hypothetical protein